MAAVHLSTPEATAAAGAALAPLLVAGDALALVGELGAGKTALTTAVVAALGVPTPATSPTFALVHRYDGGRLLVWHVDLYRVDHARELHELGLDDVVGVARGPSAGVALVEWADRFAVMPREHLRIELAHQAGGGRALTIVGVGARGAALATAWHAALQAGMA
jgi:tRNA threonylcarbamoyladenosine biosynthesis protein TsaE